MSADAGAQRRNRDREHVEAVEQVLAELAALDEFDQVLVRRRDEPEIDLDRALGADGVDLALLQRAQQLHLRIERQFADLVEEQRAAVGLGELAGVLLGGAGEGALLVAEQDGLDEVLRQRAAIDGDERPAAPLRPALDRAGEQFLADAGFALDQHRDRSISPPARRAAACAPCSRPWCRCRGTSVRRRPRRVARRSSSSSASTRSAFLIDTCSRSAPTGLTTKSSAPARIAEMTASIEPCAVCTMAGVGDARAGASASARPCRRDRA